MTNVSMVSREALAFQNRRLAEVVVHTDKIDEEMSISSSSSSEHSVTTDNNIEEIKEESEVDLEDWTEQETKSPTPLKVRAPP